MSLGVACHLSDEEEELPCLAVAWEGAVGVLAYLVGLAEEDAGDVVGLAGEGGTGSGGLVFAEVEGSGGGVVVALQQVVADAADVGAKLEGVVAEDFGDDGGKVDVRFRAQPGQRLRIADERIGGAVLAVAGEVRNLEGDLAAAGDDVVGAVGAVAGDAERVRVVGAVVGLLGGVAGVRDAGACLQDQGVGKTDACS